MSGAVSFAEGDETHSIICGTEQGTVAGDRNARDGHIRLRDELMGAVVCRKIPHADAAAPVAGDDLALVWMDDYIVDWRAMVVAALDGAAAGFPDLDGAVLRARHHPLALAVECDASDVAGVALEGEERVGVCRLDVEELDGVVAGGGKEALIGRDT